MCQDAIWAIETAFTNMHHYVEELRRSNAQTLETLATVRAASEQYQAMRRAHERALDDLLRRDETPLEKICRYQQDRLDDIAHIFFTTVLLFLLSGILWTLDATFCAINDEIHRHTERQRLCKILRVSFGQSLCLSKRHVQDHTECMNPFIDTTLTRLKEERDHFLKWIDFEIKENKEQLIFHRSEMGFVSTTIASLAGFLGDMLVIHVGMISHGKGYQ